MPSLVADRYEIVRELDRGGMGEVLLARQINLGRLVVIKRVLPEQARPEFIEALREEAKLAARLHHPNIVSIFDVGEEGDDYVAMEYVAGVTLREMIAKSPSGLPVDLALAIALDVLRGLAYAHEAKNGPRVGVVHRDIKPRNVMVTFAGISKLIDFGISRWLDRGAYEATSVSGTQGYMPPEQLLKKPLDGRTDQYALGVTLREMLTGAPPDDDERTRSKSKPVRGTIEPKLAAIVDRACAEQAADRFPDCGEMAEALAAYAKANDLDPSAMCVSKWLETHLADRIAAWERDAERASKPEIEVSTRTLSDAQPTTNQRKPASKARATTGPTVADKPKSDLTTTKGEQIAPPKPKRRSVAIAAVAGVVLAGGGIYFATRSTATDLPPATDAGPLVVDVRAGGGEPWLDLATENIARVALRDAPERRFWIGDRGVTIELRLTRASSNLQLVAIRDGAAFATVEGTSVHEAVSRLTPLLVTTLNTNRTEQGPDAAERARMAKLGARSYEQYRKFRTLFEGVREPGWFDSTDAVTGYQALVTEDPAWGHPYAELSWLLGRVTPRAKQLLADATKHVDPKRGGGLALLNALDLETRGTQPDAQLALELSEPVFRGDNEDLLAGEVVNSALRILGREDEAAAITRRQRELFPALFYVGDVSDDLMKQGRERDAEQLLRETLERRPESLTGLRAMVKLLARRGDVAGAKAMAARMQLIHGERSLALAEVYEAMLAAEELTGAQRMADRLMAGSPLSRVRGRYRNAVIAIFEGRFDAAYRSAKQAHLEGAPFGSEGERQQALNIVFALGPVVGETRDTIERLEKTAKGLDEDLTRDLGFSYRYAAALLSAPGTCPDIDQIVRSAPDPSRLRRRLWRASAQIECVPCQQMVAAGFLDTEPNAMALVAFGRCARKVGEPALARRAFDRATAMWSSWNNYEASPYHAILAYYELGKTLVELGDKAGARAALERFLRAWGHADRPVPEVADAERLLKSL